MPSYKLSYFPLKGRAEPIRYIFHQANIDFEDNRFPRDQWPTIKPTMHFGQVPVLEVDGKQLAQSMTIARFVANEGGLAGKNNWEKALADQFVDGVTDLLTNARPVAMAIMSGDEEKKKTAYAEFKAGAYGDFLNRYEKFLESNGGNYLVGSAVTWADLVVAEFNDRMLNFDKDLFAKHPVLAKHHATVHNLPNIKKYVDARPKSDF